MFTLGENYLQNFCNGSCILPHQLPDGLSEGVIWPQLLLPAGEIIAGKDVGELDWSKCFVETDVACGLGQQSIINWRSLVLDWGLSQPCMHMNCG